jgi:hypothetical protein
MRWRPLPAFAAIDFLSCLLVVFVAVALTSSPPQVKTYGDYAVVITWPRTGHNDVDLYLRDPAGHTSYFEKPQAGSMQLEHDDLGTRDTSYKHAKQNQERTVIRSATPGQWIANVALYSRDPGANPIPVAITLWDLRGNDRVVYSDRRGLTEQGEEKTAFRFTIDSSGGAGEISHLSTSLMSSTTSFTG